MRWENRMELWGAILKALVYLVVYFYEEILFGLGEWAAHKLKGGNNPKPGKTN